MLDINCLYDKIPNNIFTAELNLQAIDTSVLETAIQQASTKLESSLLKNLDGAKEQNSQSISGFNLKPVDLRDQRPLFVGPPQPRIIQDPFLDIRPAGLDPFQSGGELFGPENPFFMRGPARHMRRDPPNGGFGFGGPGFGPMG